MRLLWGVLSVVLVSSVAVAQDASFEVDEDEGAQEVDAGLDQAARLVYESANSAFEAGRFEEALERFQTAHRLSNRPALLYNVALSFDRLERKDEALEMYERFVREAPQDAGVDRAQARIEILRRVLAERDASSATTDTDTDTADLIGGAPPDNGGRSLAGPIALLGVGGAGLITWAAAGLIARGRYKDAETGPCDDGCKDDIRTPALVADIGLGIGAAAAVGGLIWLLVGGGDDADAAAFRLAPVGGAGVAGLEASGRF